MSSRLPAGVRLAGVASAAMLAQQVAGKATRDALFLSNFSVKALPLMMGVSSVASLVVVRPARSAVEILADLRRSPEAVPIAHVGQPR